MSKSNRTQEWQYKTTKGPRKSWYDENVPPEGEGWERDASKGVNGWERFDHHEESYWKRPIPDIPDIDGLQEDNKKYKKALLEANEYGSKGDFGNMIRTILRAIEDIES